MKREPKSIDRSVVHSEEYRVRRSAFASFGPSLLGMEEISKTKETFEAIAVILDLKDFTTFCDQRDPHHEVPQFIDRFLHWLFQRIAGELFIRSDGNKVVLSSRLPIFGKFLGDGVLLLWDARDLNSSAKEMIIRALDLVCTAYQTELYKELSHNFTRPPTKLRCGIAQGLVTSIANGKDYVGLCINIAARLQKLRDGALSFAFTKKGLKDRIEPSWYDDFTLIKIVLRGVANEEMVYVLNREFTKLSKNEQRRLRTY